VINHRTEIELLLTCSRFPFGPGGPPALRQLVGADLDWSFLSKAASRHGVLPLLCHRLLAHCRDLVPGPVSDQLREELRQNAQRNLALAHELVRILSLFAAQGISAVPFKGPILAVSAYGNLAWRNFNDLDIYITAASIPQGKRLLVSLGYLPDVELTAARERAFLKHYYDLGFWHQDKGIYVELHWKLTRWHFSALADSLGLWDRLEHLPLAGRPVLIFSPEDSLIILCAHGAMHLFARLAWICDISALINSHPGMNWPLVRRLAGSLNCQKIVYLGLLLAEDLLQAPLPAEISRLVQNDPSLKPLAVWIRKRLFPESAPPATRLLEEHFFRFKLRERLVDKFHHFLDMSFSPTDLDFARISLNRPFIFLYRLAKPLRLLKEHYFRVKGFQRSE
jgi:hypothetical protein